MSAFSLNIGHSSRFGFDRHFFPPINRSYANPTEDLLMEDTVILTNHAANQAGLFGLNKIELINEIEEFFDCCGLPDERFLRYTDEITITFIRKNGKVIVTDINMRR